MLTVKIGVGTNKIGSCIRNPGRWVSGNRKRDGADNKNMLKQTLKEQGISKGKYCLNLTVYFPFNLHYVTVDLGK